MAFEKILLLTWKINPNRQVEKQEYSIVNKSFFTGGQSLILATSVAKFSLKLYIILKQVMAEETEKRGPVEKGEKGWPVNPIGVVALVIFGIIIIFFIAKPLFQQKVESNFPQQTNSAGGSITSPQAGQIIKSDTLPLEISIDEPQKVDKVQYWAKTYADGNWQMIGEVTKAPYALNWKIPSSFKNKAVAITAHIYQKDGNVIKDPGGWREGIIILSN